MGIIRHTNFDKKVNTIADRNAITKKINHMTVLVNDAIADINAGAGKATYRWDTDDNSWILISKSSNETVSFITEELVIANREVTLSNYPMNNAVWNAVIINNGSIQGDLNLNTITITGGKILNMDPAFNGQILRLTYAYGTMVAQLNSVIEEKVNLAVTEATGNMDLLALESNIIPLLDDTLEIGSPTNRFKSIYVNEAYLSTNTLYIGDTPILGTEADTITIKADPDQSMLIKTSGVGSTLIQSAQEVNLTTNGMNADIKLNALGINSKVRIGGQGGIELTTTATAQDNFNVSGNLTVTGNIVHNGGSFVTNATTVTTKDNIIVLNQGEIGNGVTAGKAGIQIDRGDAADFQLIFDETTDKFTVGLAGGVHETIGTREYIDSSLTSKVDKVAGKQLSTEDYTTLEKSKLSSIATNANNYVKPVNEPISYITDLQSALDTKATTIALNTEKARIDAILSGAGANADTFAEIVTLINSVDTTNDTAFSGYVTSNNARSTTIETTLGNKVDKVAGKQLSTEDYTSTEKTKLAGIATGAQVNVPTDLSLGTATATVLPLNSSTGVDVNLPSATTTTAGLLSAADKTKLNGLSNYVKPVNEPISYITGLQTALDGKASTTYVDGKFTDLIGVAPAALDTLKEIADQLANDESAVSALTTTVSNKVDKVAGKQLSTEDYTTAEKTKLNGIATGANNYILPNASSTVFGGIKVSSTTQTVAANAVTTTASKTYAVQLDASGNALVNVPWTDTDTIYSHPTSGVTAGTYKSVTVNAQGHITAGTNPTTLAGYGITDAATNTHTHTDIYEPVISIGTSVQYLRGDKTWQNMPTSLPASDVSAWAKAAVKPTYTAAEVGALPTSGGALTGALTAIRETKVAMAANAIDLTAGNLFTKTISTATTFTVSGALASGNANSFMLELTNAGAYTITWWAGVKWPGGVAPTLTASGVDILGFYSHDGGVTWRGFVSKDSK